MTAAGIYLREPIVTVTADARRAVLHVAESAPGAPAVAVELTERDVRGLLAMIDAAREAADTVELEGE